ncbi:MAG: ACP S-malonyltransferase [Candidatus Babeliales bacterium]
MKIGILFSGYGNQFVGMGKCAYDESRIIQEYFETASSCLDINFVKLCFASSDVELATIKNAYLSLFLTNVALYALLKDKGIQPHLIAGHGIGEYAAIYAAGGISFPDALYLLNKYATFYSEQIQNHQLAVLHVQGGDDALLEQLCKEATNDEEFVAIAVHNAHDDHYVAGTRDAVETFRIASLAYADVRCINVDEGYGIHADMMEPVLEKLNVYLPKVDFKDLKIPVITCVDAVRIVSSEPAKMSLLRQVHNPILWSQVMANFAGCDAIITVGPGAYVQKLVAQRYPEKKVLMLSTLQDMVQVVELLNQKPKE